VIDFTVPPELDELLGRVRAYIDEEARPAEREIADPEDILASWDVVERLRDAARERGIFAPHMPEEWGGLGVGVLGMALISQELGTAPLAALGMNAMATCTRCCWPATRPRTSGSCARWPRAACARASR
jgi:acyl-CoA dehydrogenase